MAPFAPSYAYVHHDHDDDDDDGYALPNDSSSYLKRTLKSKRLSFTLN